MNILAYHLLDASLPFKGVYDVCEEGSLTIESSEFRDRPNLVAQSDYLWIKKILDILLQIWVEGGL